MYVKRGFFSCCQHNKLIRAFEGFLSLRSFVPRHCRARQGRLDESKAKGKKGKGKGKGKGKRPKNSDAQTCGSTCIPQLSLSL